jgi:hypothetical protein
MRAPEPEPYVPPILGMALPSGARWRILVQGGEGARPGRPVQGLLFTPADPGAGLRLADVAAGLGSLLADSRRVLCADDARRLVPTLNIAAKRFAHDASRRRVERSEAVLDPAAAALEALSLWLEDGAGGARDAVARRT